MGGFLNSKTRVCARGGHVAARARIKSRRGRTAPPLQVEGGAKQRGFFFKAPHNCRDTRASK